VVLTDRGRKTKTILVTGGAGFLGSHLCERLLAQGNRVICADNFFTGREANIAGFADHAQFSVLHHDICQPLDVTVDQIYNLGCPASPIHYQSDPVRTVRTNVLGALNMLDLAAKTGARILQASTSEVYGDPEQHPQAETYWGHVNPIGVRACYDEGKRCAETLFFDYHRQKQVDIRVARIFNTYGPRMQADDGRVVSNFIVQAMKGQPITVFGTGEHTRSFCYVDDMTGGLIALMESEIDGHMPVNLGNPTEISIKALAELIAEIAGVPFELAPADLPQDDPVRRRPDIARARQMLDWSPKVDLREGLSRTIAYFALELAESV
jgi:UDP-glucuronate decarboxylase